MFCPETVIDLSIVGRELRSQCPLRKRNVLSLTTSLIKSLNLKKSNRKNLTEPLVETRNRMSSHLAPLLEVCSGFACSGFRLELGFSLELLRIRI